MMKQCGSLGMLVLTAACAAATPPTIDTDDVAAFETEFTRISALPLADTLPTGTATFTGEIAGDLTIDGETGWGMLADMTLSADFSQPASLDGEVSEINLTQDGAPQQLAGGTLDISGEALSSGLISGLARGTVDAVSTDLPFRGTSELRLRLNGALRADDDTTAVSGNWAGVSIGGTDDDFFVVGDGQFYATAD